MATYRRVYDYHVTCRLTANNRDQLRDPTLGNRVWATFIFTQAVVFLSVCQWQTNVRCKMTFVRVHIRPRERWAMSQCTFVMQHLAASRSHCGVLRRRAAPRGTVSDVNAALGLHHTRSAQQGAILNWSQVIIKPLYNYQNPFLSPRQVQMWAVQIHYTNWPRKTWLVVKYRYPTFEDGVVGITKFLGSTLKRLARIMQACTTQWVGDK